MTGGGLSDNGDLHEVLESLARGVHSLLYFAHTCVRDLLLGWGHFNMQKGYKVKVFYM